MLRAVLLPFTLYHDEMKRCRVVFITYRSVIWQVWLTLTRGNAYFEISSNKCVLEAHIFIHTVFILRLWDAPFDFRGYGGLEVSVEFYF